MDNESFISPIDELKQCDAIRGIIEDTGEDEMPCPTIAGQELERICLWCHENPLAVDDPEEKDELSDWEIGFFQSFSLEDPSEHLEAVKRLFVAANYLGAAVLTRHCALFMTTFVSARSPQEVRELFGLSIITDKDELVLLARLLKIIE